MTNRIRQGSPQLFNKKISPDPNIKNHKKIADAIQKRHKDSVIETKANISGFFMAIPKYVWNKIKFNDEKNFLGVDWDYCEKLHNENVTVYVMQGLYVFHYYRLLEGINNKKHLIKT